jgi:hypothetical protein
VSDAAVRDDASLAAAAAAWLTTPAGSAALAGAVRAALDASGAPTRPGGEPGRLGDRLGRREPLCEDTDWECALGPFRDTSIVRGSLGELAAARLTDLSFGLGVLARHLEPEARATLDPLVDALDEADARRQVTDAVAAAILGPLRSLPIATAIGS